MVIDEVPSNKREQNFLINPIINENVRSHELTTKCM
jgi:hypothetical protein